MVEPAARDDFEGKSSKANGFFDYWRSDDNATINVIRHMLKCRAAIVPTVYLGQMLGRKYIKRS
jgi:hypothetical protein